LHNFHVTGIFREKGSIAKQRMLGEKAPYVVTLIVAALAWAVTHIVDRLLTTPLLTYRSQIIQGAGNKSLYLTLKNITKDKTFRNVHLIITSAQGEVMRDPAVIPIQPAWEGDQPWTLSGSTLEYNFSEIQPGSQFEVSVTFAGREQPTVRMSSENTIDFARPSWETWIVENENFLLACLLGFGIIALILAAFFASRTPAAKQYDT
jgi:hypothetical protein